MRLPFDGSFRTTQGFGENPDSYARFGMKGHNGIDFATPTGTPIRAVHAGKVIESLNDVTGYGKYVKIENNEEGSLYGHLLNQTVGAGQLVSEGEIIGYSNNTGNSTGPHLHFGYYKLPRIRSNGYAGYIDPQPYFGGDTKMVQVPAETFEELVTKATKWDDVHPITLKLLHDNEETNKQKDGIIAEKDRRIHELEGEFEAFIERNEELASVNDRLLQANNQLKIELEACENQECPELPFEPENPSDGDLEPPSMPVESPLTRFINYLKQLFS